MHFEMMHMQSHPFLKSYSLSSQFAGAFSDVIFAIVEPEAMRDSGNIAIFRDVLCSGLHVVGATQNASHQSQM